MKILKAISLIITVMLILGLGTAQASVNAQDASYLEVTGNAVITARPDTAKITLGIETSHTLAEQATQNNAELMHKVLQALQELGLTPSQITTSGYSINSYMDTFNRINDEQAFINYQVQNQITITTTDLDQVGKIVDAAVQAGANQVHEVSFDLASKEDLQLQALKGAIKQAQEKAAVMAASADVDLGGIISVKEEYGSYVPYTESTFLKADTSIIPRDVEVNAQVTMVYWF